jgi:hypothetical protein
MRDEGADLLRRCEDDVGAVIVGLLVRVTFTPPPASPEEHILHQRNDPSTSTTRSPITLMPHIIPPFIIMSRIMGKRRP